MDGSVFRREQLAEKTRSLIRAVRVTDVDDVAMTEAQALIERATAILGATSYEGPHWHLGSGLVDEAIDLINQPYYPYSPVIGRCNPIAPPATFEVVRGTANGGESRVVTGYVTLTEAYNGPPWNLAHGGIIAHVFDELLGIATLFAAAGGYTASLTVHYRKPTPILEPLELRGWVERVEGRKVFAKGEIRTGGVVTAEADGLFIQSMAVLVDEPT